MVFTPKLLTPGTKSSKINSKMWKQACRKALREVDSISRDKSVDEEGRTRSAPRGFASLLSSSSFPARKQVQGRLHLLQGGSASWGCLRKTLQAGWYQPQKSIFSPFWSLGAETGVVAVLSLELTAATCLLCLPWACALCTHSISSSPDKDTAHVGLVMHSYELGSASLTSSSPWLQI